MATEPKTKEGDPLSDLYGEAPVVLARAESLQPLQALCHEEDDVVPTLLTARYRLRGGRVFGNLLVALASDLQAVAVGKPGPRSATCSPPPGRTGCGRSWRPEAVWPPRCRRAVASPSSGCGRSGVPSQKALPSHRRLVLFCELEGEPDPPQPEWMAITTPELSLPRNVTIVVSRAPRGWTGPEIEAPQGASGSEEVFTFVEAALSGDQAAEVDRLGVAPLADGLARLIMLPADAAADRRRPGAVGLGQVLVRRLRARGARPARPHQPRADARARPPRGARRPPRRRRRRRRSEGRTPRSPPSAGTRPQERRRPAAGARAPRAPGRHLRLLQRLALRGLRAGVGRAGARDHRRHGGHAEPPRAAVVADRLRVPPPQARFLGRLRGAGRAGRPGRRAGDRARRRRRGRRRCQAGRAGSPPCSRPPRPSC